MGQCSGIYGKKKSVFSIPYIIKEKNEDYRERGLTPGPYVAPHPTIFMKRRMISAKK